MIFLWVLISTKLSIDRGIQIIKFWEICIFGDHKIAPFWIWLIHVTEANFQVALGLKNFLMDPNTTSNDQKFDQKFNNV